MTGKQADPCDLCGRDHEGQCPAARKTNALFALLWAWSDAAEAGALTGASLQVFGDDAAETLEMWAASRGVAVESRTITPATPLSNGVTEWPIVSVALPGGGWVTAHRGIWA